MEFDPSKIERYDCTTGGSGYGEMELSEFGAYVLASDYDALLALYHEAVNEEALLRYNEGA